MFCGGGVKTGWLTGVVLVAGKTVWFLVNTLNLRALEIALIISKALYVNVLLTYLLNYLLTDRETDGQTDTRWQQMPRLHSVARVKITFERLAVGMTFKVTQGYWNWLLAVTFRSPSSTKTSSKLQATCAFRFMCKHIVDNAWRIHELCNVEWFQTEKVTSMVVQGHWQWCHSIGHISARLQLSLSYTVSEILTQSYFPKYKEVTWHWPRPLGGTLSSTVSEIQRHIGRKWRF